MKSQIDTPQGERSIPQQRPLATDGERTWLAPYKASTNDHITTSTIPSSTLQPGAEQTSQQPDQNQQQQQPPRPSITEAAKSIKASEFLSLHQTPCARQGFLVGIGGGAAIGALRFILGARIPKAANWAVGAGLLGMVFEYEYCQFLRRQERAKMQRVVEVQRSWRAEERARQEAARERIAAEETAKAASSRSGSWFRFW